MNAATTLVILATAGTAALVGAAFALGFNSSALIADEAAAKHFVYTHSPDLIPTDVVLSEDRKSALVGCEGNRVLLVTMLGDGPVVRRLTPSDVVVSGAGKIQIDVKDFGFPKRDFRANNPGFQAILDTLNKAVLQ